MYISENDLKVRVLTGQLDIFDDVLNDLGKWYDESLLLKHKFTFSTLKLLIIKFGKHRTTLAREKRELETRG